MLKLKFHLKLRFKVLGFFIFYALAFYWFRTSDFFNYRMLVANLDSIPWLYSTIGLIFGVISAFIIQKEWDQISELTDAIKGENNALYELWLWSQRLPAEFRKKIQVLIKDYLETIIGEGWQRTENGEISKELDKIIRDMHAVVADLNEQQPLSSSIAFSLLNNIMGYREKRMRFGSDHMPKILLYTLRLATLLMITLCPLIAVKDIYLDFIFTMSISFLSFCVYLVAVDMNHPLRPGGWHITTGDYKKLLAKLK